MEQEVPEQSLWLVITGKVHPCHLLVSELVNDIHPDCFIFMHDLCAVLSENKAQVAVLAYLTEPEKVLEFFSCTSLSFVVFF